MKTSVYITSYNQKKYLVEAIESVLAQTFFPSEIVIVDDFSTDGSQEVIAGYVARYPAVIEAVYHSRNCGVARTRIDALSRVTGDFVTYVDGDDRFLPTKLEKEAKLLQENPDVPIAFANNYYINVTGMRTGLWANGVNPPQGYVFSQTFGRGFPRRNLFRMELVSYPAWARVGFHDPSLTLYEDFDMRIRLTKRYPVIYCNEPLSEIRVHKTGLSSAAATEHLEAIRSIYCKNRPLLDDLSLAERREIQHGLGRWMGGFARRAARAAVSNSGFNAPSIMRALKYRFLDIKYRCGYIDP